MSSTLSNDQKNKIFKLPIIRGAIGLYEAMKIGYSTLNWSAAMSEESSDKKTYSVESSDQKSY